MVANICVSRAPWFRCRKAGRPPNLAGFGGGAIRAFLTLVV
ncbi:Uncharacterised protein [Vibrio cholerae]|nr:Uncharacterised protein [Vibrio cholerae]